MADNDASRDQRGIAAFIAFVICSASVMRSAHSLQSGSSGASPMGDVKIYLYDLPPTIPVWPQGAYWEVKSMEDWLRRTRHYTANGEEADFFWIPGFRSLKNLTAYLEVFNHIRTAYPFWNATRNRHILAFIYDFGVGDVNGESRLRHPQIPDDINPASPERSVLFLQYNGIRDGHDGRKARCRVCFQKGKDIMLPTGNNVCGPLCGYNLKTLQAKSMWSQAHQQPHHSGGSGVSQLTMRPRKHLMFFSGVVSDRQRYDFTGRGGVFTLYKNHSDYLILNSGPPHKERVEFSEAMQDSEFCYSPRGFTGGDTDRYLAGMMFGCIPVFLSFGGEDEPMAYPFEEVIPWQLFSTSIALKDLHLLDMQLRSLLPHVSEMRRHMAHFIRPLLYTSRYGSYFGEPPDRDAMHTLMLVLQKRLMLGESRRG